MQIDTFEVRDFPGLAALGVGHSDHGLRVCVLTEEILGPVRNGGIASTYYHLARGLAAEGHDVHVLFLKGRVVQDETPEHWVDHFAQAGITLHYLDLPDTEVWGTAPEWQRRYAAAYRWLRDQPRFDVVHTTEWRGGAVYALMAKRLGLAFGDTLFVVKTSSPHIWNRHYQMAPIVQHGLLGAAYAEQRCVELADVVVGGSAHLISFMEHIGYRLPPVNVLVQPNIVDFSNVPVTDERAGPPRQPGDTVPGRHLVFFGRVEARKGIELFCNALDLLKERGTMPESLTFLGKWGGRLASQGGTPVHEYVAAKAEGWGIPVDYVTDLNQPDALSLLCSRDQIAVMPSLIENSTMAVYEALEHRIPFVATAVGGTPELIDEADHDRCLVEPRSQALADRLEEVLAAGQVIARPSFSNADNLKAWYGFHAHVAETIATLGSAAAVARLTAGIDPAPVPVETAGHVVLARRGDNVAGLADALVEARPDQVVLGYGETGLRTAVDEAAKTLAGAGCEVEVVDCVGIAAGDAFNRLVSRNRCDALVVVNGADVRPRPGFFEAVRTALSHQPSALVTSFFTSADGLDGMPLGGDVASHILTARAYGPELVALRPETFAALGEFEPYDLRWGTVHELVTRACQTDHQLSVVPEPLLEWTEPGEWIRAVQGDPLYAYARSKAVIDDSDLAHRKVTLASLLPGFEDNELRSGQGRWLIPAEWRRVDPPPETDRRLVVGLEDDRDELHLVARGPGERRLTVRGIPQPIDLVEAHGRPDGADRLTRHRFRVPATWQPGESYPMAWGLHDGATKLQSHFLRISLVAPNTYALASQVPVLTRDATDQLVDQMRGAAPDPTDPAADLDAARAALQEGDLATARRLVAPLSVAAPLGPAALLLARVEMRAGDPEAAARLLDPILERRPGHHHARELRARARLDLGDKEAAAADLAVVLKEQPNQPAALRLQDRIEAASVHSRAAVLVAELDARYPAARADAADPQLRAIAQQLSALPPGKGWTQDATLAKAAYFAHAADVDRALRNYDPHLIEISVEFDYISWPRRIQEHVRGSSVLDVGCGFGGFGMGFLVAGATSYAGLDPAMDLDSSSAKNKRLREWADMGVTPREIARELPAIRLFESKAEDLALEDKFDTVSLHNVTEHLLELERVLAGLVPLCEPESKLVYHHHNYYCWNGHHFAPNRPDQLDESDPEHREIYDWRHIDSVPSLAQDHYFLTGLNRVRLDELREITERYFVIEQWDEIPSSPETLARLTPEVLDRVRRTIPDLTERDLSVNAVLCVATPKSGSLG